MSNEIKKRWKANTPKFFKKLVNIGIGIGVVGGALLTAPVSLPVAIVSMGGYMVTVGTITAVVAKLTKEDSTDENER